MVEGNPSDEGDLDAGEFSSWLGQMRSAIRGEGGSDVPCGSCTACCTSSQFIHIAPDETDTLSHIPAELLFPAPRLPRGHVLLGYDERGHCPMLIDNKCSIYDHRPRTCRTYDCRVFPASGLEIDGPGKAPIARQARRWRFRFSADVDRQRHRAVEAAARFLDEHEDLMPSSAAPTNATQAAVLAIEISDAFLGQDEATGQTTVIDPDPDVVRAAVMDARPTGRQR